MKHLLHRQINLLAISVLTALSFYVFGAGLSIAQSEESQFVFMARAGTDMVLRREGAI